MKKPLLLALVVLVLGALAAGVMLLLELRAATAPPTPSQVVQATWTVYRLAPGHQAHVGSQGVDCSACHAAKTDAATDRPGPGACVSCHEERSQIEHALVDVDEQGRRVAAGPDTHQVADCTRCHSFGPDPEVKPTDCMGCHARKQNDVPPVMAHADEACTSCHDVHANVTKPLDCQSCHSIKPHHGSRDEASASRCLDCHRAHAPALVTEERCRACHTTTSSNQTAPVIPATATEGWHRCTGCHEPHEFKKENAKACTSCHGPHPALAGAGHGQCTSCHAPHAARESVTSQNVCTTCHRNVTLVHNPKVAPTAACTTCHTAHPVAKAAQPSACTSCHGDIAATDLSAHAPEVACKGCHVPHDFVKAESGHTSCTSCHAERLKALASHPGHSQCESCHKQLPHGGIKAPVACGSCHGDKLKVVFKGHSNCTQCHDEHTGAREKACADCHAEQASHLSKKHGACQSCHDAHVATPAAAVTDCSGCHQKKALPSLHQEPKHVERCSSCHDVHGSEPVAARATCIACHQDRKDHQPEAARCDGCHAFRAPPKPGSRP